MLLVACGATAHAAEPRAPIRLVPPIEGKEVATLGVESDGARRLVAYGLRSLAHSDGSLETASQFFPLSRNVQAAELPTRLGGGFLFSIVSSGRTAMWRAAHWTGLLEPFAELDFELERLIPGFDRVYVQARRTGEWAALDASTGSGLELGSLPRSPNYGAMVFVDEWFAAVELPVRGTVVSFDAGNRWHRLGLTTLALGRVEDELLIATPDGRRALASDGSLRPLETGADEREATSEPRRVTPEGPLGAMPLRTAVLRGFPERPGIAVVAAGGALARVRLADGLVLAIRERVMSEASTCNSVRLGQGFGFVCGEPQGKTRIFRFEAPLTLLPVLEFETPRAINDSGNGGLVIRGRCGPKPADALHGSHCVLAPQGTRWELSPASAAFGVERVVALRDGRAVSIAPPRLKNPGTLLVQAEKGEALSIPLVIGGSGRARSLLEKGFWLDGFVQATDGSLRGWVTGQGVFAGVRVGLDGRVHAGPLQRSIERASLSGERALVVPATGVAEQTIDGGQTWTDADLPVEIEPDITKAPGSNGRIDQGCSALGCAFLGWLRIGWNGPSGSEPLPVAASPKHTALPSPGGGRWLMRCSPTGEVSPAVPRVVASPPTNEPAREDGQGFWLPLIERPPPALSRGALAFDTGNERELRAYAWAPRGAEFGKVGKFQVSVADRFQVGRGVWTTLAAQSPWDDPVHVAEVFGYEGSSPAVWNATLDSSGRAGILAITARGTTDLFSIEEDRAPQFLVNAPKQGIGAISSAVRIGSTYYVSAQEDGRTFRVFALESGKAHLLGQYADVALGRTINPVLVRSIRGGALGIWGRGAGWYVFPLDRETGEVEPPIEMSARELSRMPPPCAPDQEGYLLEGSVGIDPYADFVDGAEDISARSFEGRFVATARGVCLSELSARAESAIDSRMSPKPKGARTGESGVPLVLGDRASGGRRWGFRCSQ